MRYTFKQFKTEYPDDDACLEAVFQNRFGNLPACPKCGVVNAKFYRVKKRQCYACEFCGGQLHPLANTIFRKSSTSLWNWFYAIYLFSVAKNGVSAKELERHLGVTYKTAWRMAKQIRLLMAQDTELLTGTVEADETYYGPHIEKKRAFENKQSIFGAVEKYGRARAEVHPWSSRHIAKQFLNAVLDPDVYLQVDDGRIYVRPRREYRHGVVNHSKGIYSQDGVTTNTIEGLWGNLKRSITGTYHVVSPKYLQSYVNEFVFRYNYRDVAVCPVLLERVGKQV